MDDVRLISILDADLGPNEPHWRLKVDQCGKRDDRLIIRAENGAESFGVVLSPVTVRALVEVLDRWARGQR